MTPPAVMKIQSVKFIKSVTAVRQVPQDARPHIAFAGRSNVGKSSLLNKLLNRKNIARVSSTPGKTQQLNFYLINDAFYFVDLPGYGFAKVSKSVKHRWKGLIEDYFTRTPELVGIVMIIDVRLEAQAMDLQLYDYLRQLELPTVVAATKADKLSNNKIQTQKSKHQTAFRFSKQDRYIVFSAKTGRGKPELIKELSSLLPDPV